MARTEKDTAEFLAIPVVIRLTAEDYESLRRLAREKNTTITNLARPALVNLAKQAYTQRQPSIQER